MDHSSAEPIVDKPYREAIAFAFGRRLGSLYHGLRSTAMRHDDSMGLVLEYLRATVYSSASAVIQDAPEEDDDDE